MSLVALEWREAPNQMASHALVLGVATFPSHTYPTLKGYPSGWSVQTFFLQFVERILSCFARSGRAGFASVPDYDLPRPGLRYLDWNWYWKLCRSASISAAGCRCGRDNIKGDNRPGTAFAGRFA